MAKILLVEDDKLQAKAIKKSLESKGFEIIWAENGKKAIKAAKTQHLDIIILDFILPDINGDEICRLLKHSEDTRGIPIIALTVKRSTEERIDGLKAGADDYLPKPFSHEELIARIFASLRTKALQDELRRMNQQLRDVLTKVEILAATDSLTGLSNRRQFETLLDHEFNKTSRYESPLSCLLIDIDNFKRINDKYGHQAGDTCLKEIAEIIKNNVRKVDTVARWGGEEFCVLMPQTVKENTMIPSSRICTAIAENAFSGYPDKITVSIGVASIPAPEIDTPEKLVKAADLAMYEAKAKGGNRVEFG